MKFSEFEYVRPNVEAMLEKMDAALNTIKNAKNGAEQIEAYNALNQEMEAFRSQTSVASIRNDLDTRNEFYAGEQAFIDQNMPLIQSKNTQISRAMAESPYKEELKEALGEFTMEKLEYTVKSMNESIIPLMQEENALCTEYWKIYSGAQIPFEGKILTVEQMPPLKASQDRATRRAAFEAEGKFFDSHREELDTIYDKLVKNRTAQAKAMGYDNYTELAVIRMRRYGYGPKEVKAFRAQVAKDLVPLVSKIKKMQAERIGIREDWKAYDNLVMFPDGNPSPKGTPDELLKITQEMYHRLSKETGEFFDFMMEGGFMDVVAREGKAPGGYCASIPSLKAPFILSNFNGGAGDVEVLTHEAGHAFQAYTAMRDTAWDNNPGLRHGSAETAEVHSMSMEFLTAEFHDMLLKEDTAKYELQHAENALAFIPYASIIDAFQYSAYEHPEWTPAERDLEWKRLLEEYQPYLTDYEDIPFYSRYGGWQYKLHVYMHPLYYIDYALAETVALQFWMLSLENKELAWEKYMQFVKSAGSRRFADTVKYVGLDSPFEEGTVKKVVDKVYQWIEAHQL